MQIVPYSDNILIAQYHRQELIVSLCHVSFYSISKFVENVDQDHKVCYMDCSNAKIKYLLLLEEGMAELTMTFWS